MEMVCLKMSEILSCLIQDNNQMFRLELVLGEGWGSINETTKETNIFSFSPSGRLIIKILVHFYKYHLHST
jgi:hypothetical protein